MRIHNGCFSVSLIFADLFRNRRQMIHPVPLNYFCALQFLLNNFMRAENMVIKESSSKYSPLYNIKFIFCYHSSTFYDNKIVIQRVTHNTAIKISTNNYSHLHHVENNPLGYHWAFQVHSHSNIVFPQTNLLISQITTAVKDTKWGKVNVSFMHWLWYPTQIIYKQICMEVMRKKICQRKARV